MPDHRPEDRKPRNLLDRASRSTIGGESTAFGFSIMITATFGAVQVGHGTPSYGDLIVFAVCASLTFAVLEGLASRGYRESMPEYASFVQTPGTAMNVVSVTAAVGAAIGLAAIIGGGVAWAVCPTAAATIYLVAETIEQMAAERIQAARGSRPRLERE
jgi:hypothetical protein